MERMNNILDELLLELEIHEANEQNVVDVFDTKAFLLLVPAIQDYFCGIREFRPSGKETGQSLLGEL